MTKRCETIFDQASTELRLLSTNASIKTDVTIIVVTIYCTLKSISTENVPNITL